MDKSIMFLCGRFGIGGTEKVTQIMANAFADCGWRVCVVAFEITNRGFLTQLDNRVEVRELSFPAYRISNVRKLRGIMRELNVRFVINQWAMPFPVTLMLMLARPSGVKIIEFFHTMPGFNKRVFEATGWKRKLLSTAVRLNFKLTYFCCDKYVVLAKCYEPLFCQLAGIRHAKKLTSIPNPILSTPENVPKEKILLYVGRLALTEKRVDRIVDAWRIISDKLPDWKMQIVGDGPDREALRQRSADLPRIEFVGFQKPDPYYARASILLLTSEAEGFGLVIVEAMAHGCVPVVLDSFPVAEEIVDDVGVLVPSPWSPVEFARQVVDLAGDKSRLDSLSRRCPEGARRYSLPRVMEKYMAMLEIE